MRLSTELAYDEANLALSEGWTYAHHIAGCDNDLTMTSRAPPDGNTNRARMWRIERWDEVCTFTTDADAIAHVRWLAAAGSKLHRKAIALHDSEGRSSRYRRKLYVRS